jgi:hypothetical protein
MLAAATLSSVLPLRNMRVVAIGDLWKLGFRISASSSSRTIWPCWLVTAQSLVVDNLAVPAVSR